MVPVIVFAAFSDSIINWAGWVIEFEVQTDPIKGIIYNGV
jgi:hypothetical protein